MVLSEPSKIGLMEFPARTPKISRENLPNRNGQVGYNMHYGKHRNILNYKQYHW